MTSVPDEHLEPLAASAKREGGQRQDNISVKLCAAPYWSSITIATVSLTEAPPITRTRTKRLDEPI